MRRIRRYRALVVAFALIACTPAPACAHASPESTSTTPWDARAVVSRMSLRAKVGQMFVIGFYGSEMSGSLTRVIRNRGIGGFILYTRNIRSHGQVARLDAALQRAARQSHHPAELLICVDQEGDPVRRFARIGPAYSQPAIGRLGARAESVARREAYRTGRKLRALGVNCDLTPVVDVSRGPGSVMHSRSFGTRPALVARLGGAAVRGFTDARVISSAKHFPGYGWADKDPELLQPTVRKSLSQLYRSDLVPYREVIRLEVPMIMVGHVSVPAVDPSGRPSSLSKRAISGLLRSRLGYDGVVCTDDIEMGAITARRSAGAAAVAAVAAGADIVLVCQTASAQQKAYDALLAAVRSGRISQAPIDESVVRILQMKRRFGLVR